MNPEIEETIVIDFVTSTAIGAAVDADSTPTCDVFEGASDTAILTPAVVKRTGKTGNYRVSVACTAANGFEIGKSYNVVVAATVGGVAAKAAVNSFQVRSNVSGGTGAFAITVRVTDGTNPLQSANVRITESASLPVTNGASSFVAATNASGQASFSLNAGTYVVTVTKGGYSFTPTIRTVTGNQAGTLIDDLVMTQNTIPSAPADLSLCRVFGSVESLDNKPVAGLQITFELIPANPHKSEKIIGARTITVTTNASGEIVDALGNPFLDLQRNDLLLPAGSEYLVTAKPAKLNKKITLSTSTRDLSSIV